MNGYAVDGSLTQGRYVAGATLRAIYQSLFFAEVGATWIRHDTPDDPIRDRSSCSVAAGVRF